ncbi:MAG: hypothetical protein NZ921_01250 [Candidatus Caldarchaeum sp.]|nr:hypothetical protein [Candidatus Caldarchaeum sp.]
MNKVFPVMEVGSLNKAPFRVKDRSKAVAEAKRWGELLGVENYSELVRLLERGSEDDSRLVDWSCLYGLRFFESAGLDLVYDGEQRRVEMYEHPLQYINGFEFRGVVRVWDNEFYRKAAVVRRPHLLQPYHLDELQFNKRHAKKPLKVPVTSAYTLADWSFNEYYLKQAPGRDFAEKSFSAKRDFVLDLVDQIIHPVLRNLDKEGVEYLQLDEPAAATKPHESELVVESINKAVKGLRSKIAVHICYTDYKALFPALLEMKADVLSISCSNADTRLTGLEPEKRKGFEILKVFKEYDCRFKIAPGLIDVHTDFVEPPELVRDRILYAVKILDDPDKVVACNDCGLRTRSWDIAYRKQVNLVAGASLARKTFE